MKTQQIENYLTTKMQNIEKELIQIGSSLNSEDLECVEFEVIKQEEASLLGKQTLIKDLLTQFF